MTSDGAKTGGCGCGGGATAMTATTSGGGGCGCGCGCDGGCETCGTDVYVQPRFFAGQLLTQEDLALGTEYVVAKNRLHNRSFFGEGVVCGLEVACDPCGGGHVAIRPGYALDCCGNDIVVPCAQTVDINAMVHRLRVETLGGYDCGDPCADVKSKGGSAAPSTGTTATTDTAIDVRLPRRRYSLYVRYCEENTDPVAPYATDEPCGAQGCEPSRIREGFTFELRCEAKPKPVDDFYTRLIACFSDVSGLNKVAMGSRMWTQLAGPMPSAVRVAQGQQRVAFGEEDAKAMKTSLVQLKQVTATDETKAADVETSLDHVRSVVMAGAKLNSLPQNEREAAIQKFGLQDDVHAAPEAARAAATKLEPQLHKLDDPFARTAAQALLSDGPALADPNAPQERNSVAYALAANGIVANTRLMRLYAGNLADVRDWLLARLDRATMLTDCALRRDVEAIRITAPTEGEAEVSSTQLQATTTASRELASALIRYVYGCICASLLPPCRPCEDTAVLLATVEVEECDVVHICNLDRTIPLTGTALAYWFPVQELARLLDAICCRLPRKLGEGGWTQVGRKVPIDQTAQAISVDTPTAGKATPYLFSRPAGVTLRVAPVATLLETAGVPSTLTERVTRAVENVAALDPVREFATPLLTRAKNVAVTADVGGVLNTEPGRAALVDAVREVAPELVAEHAREAAAGVAATAATEAVARAQQAAVAAAATAASDAVQKVAVDRLAKVEERLKDLTSLKRDLTTLRKRSETLAARNAELERRVAQLSGGG